MMKVKVNIVFILICLFIAGCGGNNNQVNDTQSSQSAQTESVDAAIVDTAKDEITGDDQSDLDAERQAMPRQVPESFPLPILDGWVEGEPYGELTTGKKQGWHAEFFYNGDPQETKAAYMQVLEELGFKVEESPVMELTNDAAFTMDGHISGIHYGGGIMFDTNFEDKQRVWMNFTERVED